MVFAPISIVVLVIVVASTLNLALLYPINHESLSSLSSFIHFKSNRLQPSLFFIDVYDLFKVDNCIIQTRSFCFFYK